MLTRLIISIFIFAHAFTSYANDKSIPTQTVKVSASSLNIEGVQYLALTYQNAPKWHTYWKNPGDAGLPLKNKFFIEGKEVTLNELEWPTPQKYIEEGNILAYGYEGTYSLFYTFKDSSFKNYEGKKISIKSQWLVCKHICIPGKKEVSGQFESDKIIFHNNDVDFSANIVLANFKKLPTISQWPTEIDISLNQAEGENELFLSYQINNANPSKASNLGVLTPFPNSLFSFKRENLFKDSSNNIFGKIALEWDGIYEEPPRELPSNGRFDSLLKLKFLYTNPIKNIVQIVEKDFSSYNVGRAESLNSFYQLLTPINNNQKDVKQAETTTSDKASKSIFYYLIFAFLGGIILNFMPCVLPVISLKLFSLIQHKKESRARIFKHNFTYTLGVLTTFFALAVIVISLKASGESIGWGFQLQSPGFVLALIIILFLMALNLFGLFEFSTVGGKFIGNINIKEDSFAGDFFSGILATILSTPCSAPFLGTALGFAFTSSPLNIIFIFLSIGVGLSLPFIMTAFIPQLLKFIPKPGNWMNHFKKFLGFTLLLTTFWLIDVFLTLSSTTQVFLKTSTLLAAIFFAIYLRQKISKKALVLIPFLVLTIYLVRDLVSNNETASLDNNYSRFLNEKRKSMQLDWQPWSEQAMDNLRAEGKLVFIDFTAKWCLTCKVNEKLILNTDSFRSLVKTKKISLLMADWTKRDPVIGNWLKAQGLAGVPAYFVQKPDGTLINLGETITIKKIEDSLD